MNKSIVTDAARWWSSGWEVEEKAGGTNSVVGSTAGLGPTDTIKVVSPGRSPRRRLHAAMCR